MKLEFLFDAYALIGIIFLLGLMFSPVLPDYFKPFIVWTGIVLMMATILLFISSIILKWKGKL